MRDAIVIGAGVIGATTALYLAREGLSVTVVDGRPESAADTSFANGGLMTPSTALPWCSPAVPRLLFKWIGREEAPLLLRPSAIPRISLWGAKFIANCRPAKHLASARELTRFARESLEETEGLIAQRTVDYRLSYGGLMELFRDETGLSARDNYAGLLESLGIRTQRLSGDDCVGLEPSLGPIGPSIGAGLLLPDDAWGDARVFTKAVEKAARDLGVHFAFGTELRRIDAPAGQIAGVETSAGRIEASKVVVCAGPASKAILRPFGVRLPIEPVKGYSISVPRAELGFLPGRPILDDTARLGVTPLGENLRVAGTVEFDGQNRAVREGRVGNLLRALARLFPDAPKPRNFSPWTGLRPMSADGMPIIDATPVRGLFVNTGHGALGWTLACGSARLVSNIVIGKAAPGASSFRLARSFW